MLPPSRYGVGNLRAIPLLFALLLLTPLRAGAVACDQDPSKCGCQKPCPPQPGKGLRRSPRIMPGFPEAAVWDLDEMPSGPPVRINMDYTQWFQLCDLAMDTWSAVSDTLPQDDVLELGTGYFPFQ